MIHPNIDAGKFILTALGFPRAQINNRSALTLLALANVGPHETFADATAPLMGITPIMDWVRENYAVSYAPNTRETVRRQTVHQFRDAGLLLYNPDRPERPVNSPRAAYQLAPHALRLLTSFGSAGFQSNLEAYLNLHGSLAQQYARERKVHRVPVSIPGGGQLSLSPGRHSNLIRQIIEGFAPIFAPGSELIYAGDTGDKMSFFDQLRLKDLGVEIDQHGKMPDVVLYFRARNWLVLVESVTSHGPVDGKRHAELMDLFADSSAGLVYVTAFPDRATMARFLSVVAWETEVWVADAPTHLIHFNGERFLGPYAEHKG